MTVSKRNLLKLLAAGAGVSVLPAGGSGTERPAGAKVEHDHEMPAHWTGNEKIAFLIYPDFTALDMVGPHYMLAGLIGATVYTVAKSKEPVSSDQKLVFVPSATFDECPADLDILCVPGGTSGTLAAMQDDATIAFLKDRGARAKWVTSVCTGSLVLAAAGLLKGYKATCHWAARDVLHDFGAEPVDARVVVDRNRITGAGVTAGLDFGLAIVAKQRDQNYAECMQLLAEYDPQPPFDAGTPAKSSQANADMMRAMLTDFSAKAREIARLVGR